MMQSNKEIGSVPIGVTLLGAYRGFTKQFGSAPIDIEALSAFIGCSIIFVLKIVQFFLEFAQPKS